VGQRSQVRCASIFAVAVAAACTFDASGVSASGGMSVGEVGTAPVDTSDAEVGSAETATTMPDPSTDDATSDGSPSECGGGTCGTPAPAGWIGPFAINTASPPNASQQCPQGWTDHGAAFIGLLAGAPTCACNCVPSASTCNVEVTYYSDAGCTMPNETGSSSGGCQNLATSESHGYVRAVGQPGNVGCAPAEQYVVPPTAWTEASVMCAPGQLPVCEDGVCLPVVPAGFEDRWCVMAEGEQACPAGPYSSPKTMHRSLTDTRDCTPCGCNVSGTPTCAGALTEHTTWCLLEIDGVPIDGQCHPTLAGLADDWAIQYDGAGAAFGCANNGPTPTGEALAVDPITICCTT
jgi:hypothetical protein